MTNDFMIFITLKTTMLYSSVSQPESADSNESAKDSGWVRKHYGRTSLL